jgi:hypothetical protein
MSFRSRNGANSEASPTSFVKHMSFRSRYGLKGTEHLRERGGKLGLSKTFANLGHK